MLRVLPSPAACSPLLRSRSTGPQPFVAEVQLRSLRYVTEPGGGGEPPAVMVKVKALESPPPAGLNTVTWALPWPLISLAEIEARSWLADTNVVVRSAPFQRTTELLANPAPLTVRVKADPPAGVLFGESEV